MLGCVQLQGSATLVRKGPLLNSQWSCLLLVWLPGRQRIAQTFQRGTDAWITADYAYCLVAAGVGAKVGRFESLQNVYVDAQIPAVFIRSFKG